MAASCCARWSPSPAGADGTTEGDLRATVHSWAESLKLQAEIISGTGDNRPRGSGRSHVTVLGHPLTAESTAAIAARITVHRRQHRPDLPPGEVPRHRRGVRGVRHRDRARCAPRWRPEAAEHRGRHRRRRRPGCSRRAQRLVVMDVDSTLIQDEVIELFAAHAGCEAEVAEVTGRRCAASWTSSSRCTPASRCWRGSTRRWWRRCAAEVRLTPGARTLIRTLKRLGYQVGVVSGGFTQVTDDLKERLGLDFASANTLEVVDGRLTGRVDRRHRGPGGQGAAAAQLRRSRPGCRWRRRWRSVTAPTTWTC